MRLVDIQRVIDQLSKKCVISLKIGTDSKEIYPLDDYELTLVAKIIKSEMDYEDVNGKPLPPDNTDQSWTYQGSQ